MDENQNNLNPEEQNEFAAENESPADESVDTNNGSKNVAAIVAIVVLLALLLYGVYAFMNRSDSEAPVVPSDEVPGEDLDVEVNGDVDAGPPATDAGEEVGQ